MVDPIPGMYPRVMPYLYIDGARAAIDFYTSVLGAAERMTMPGPDDKIGHAELAIGDSVHHVGRRSPRWGSAVRSRSGGRPWPSTSTSRTSTPPSKKAMQSRRDHAPPRWRTSSTGTGVGSSRTPSATTGASPPMEDVGSRGDGTAYGPDARLAPRPPSPKEEHVVTHGRCSASRLGRVLRRRTPALGHRAAAAGLRPPGRDRPFHRGAPGRRLRHRRAHPPGLTERCPSPRGSMCPDGPSRAARRKANERASDARFRGARRARARHPRPRLSTPCLDSGLFHVFDDTMCAGYVAALGVRGPSGWPPSPDVLQ